MTHEFKTVLYTESSGIATITLNRAEKRNAISYDLIDDLTAALKQAANSPAQVVILTGAGKAFCSGMDLDNLKQLTGRTHEQNVQDSETMASLFRTLYDFPKPTIAAVNGPAIAGGTGLATLCDFTLAVPEAKFGYTEVRIGFVPAIVSSFLIANIGEKRARNLLLTGRIFGAEEALKLGLVNEIVAPERLILRAQELAAQLLENSPTSLQATKKLLSSYTREQLDRQVSASGAEQRRDPPDRRLQRRHHSISGETQTHLDRKIENGKREDLKTKIWGETRLRVRYAETDKMGVVYHSNFVIWFEVGRVELLRQLGFQYSDMETDDNCHIPVVDLRVRYKSPASMMMRSWCVPKSRMCVHRCCTSAMKFSVKPTARCWPRARPCTSSSNSKLERTTLPEKYLQAFNGLKRI